jgi:hypothetical protein
MAQPGDGASLLGRDDGQPSPPRDGRGELKGEFVRYRNVRLAGVRLQWLVWPLDRRRDDAAEEVDVLGRSAAASASRSPA